MIYMVTSSNQNKVLKGNQEKIHVVLRLQLTNIHKKTQPLLLKLLILYLFCFFHFTDRRVDGDKSSRGSDQRDGWRPQFWQGYPGRYISPPP